MPLLGEVIVIPSGIVFDIAHKTYYLRLLHLQFLRNILMASGVRAVKPECCEWVYFRDQPTQQLDNNMTNKLELLLCLLNVKLL